MTAQKHGNLQGAAAHELIKFTLHNKNPHFRTSCYSFECLCVILRKQSFINLALGTGIISVLLKFLWNTATGAVNKTLRSSKHKGGRSGSDSVSEPMND